MGEYPLPHDKLIPALIQFQLECPAIKKYKENTFITKKNEGKKAMYADLASINELIREPLAKNGFAISQPICNGVLETYLFHTSGQYLKSEIKLSVDGKASQAVGSEITYMRRYCLCAILNLAPEDDDDDGNGAMPPEKQQPNTNTQAQSKTRSSGPQMSNAAQHSTIDVLREKCGWSQDDLAAEIKKKYSAGRLQDLTMTQAKEMMDALRAIKPDAKLAALLFKMKHEGGTFTMETIEKLTNKQIEWYANNCNDKERQQAANEFMLTCADRFVNAENKESTAQGQEVGGTEQGGT